MKTEAKSALNTRELLSDLFILRKAITSEDERIGIENILKKKCLCYIHFLNVADEVILFVLPKGR